MPNLVRTSFMRDIGAPWESQDSHVDILRDGSGAERRGPSVHGLPLPDLC